MVNVQLSSTGLELPSLRGSGSGSSSISGSSSYARGRQSDPGGGSLSGALMQSEHPSEAMREETSTGAIPSSSPTQGLLATGGFRDALNFEALSAKVRFMLMEDASETQEEEVEMMDYDNPEDHILERKLDEDHRPAASIGAGGAAGGGHGAGSGGSGGGGASGLGMSGLRQPGSRMGNWGSAFAGRRRCVMTVSGSRRKHCRCICFACLAASHGAQCGCSRRLLVRMLREDIPIVI